LDKSNIREDAAIELEKILDVMVENPTIKINVKSHTDSRASFEYNEQLSERRAKSTLEWLVKNGIDAGRLTAKGYGERELVNKCSDDVPCSEEEHQANRRSEFIINGL
jgi:outer membrane protein OmpA-like peptidoglycan-associated protein